MKLPVQLKAHILAQCQGKTEWSHPDVSVDETFKLDAVKGALGMWQCIVLSLHKTTGTIMELCFTPVQLL